MSRRGSDGGAARRRARALKLKARAEGLAVAEWPAGEGGAGQSAALPKKIGRELNALRARGYVELKDGSWRSPTGALIVRGADGAWRILEA